MMSGLAPFCVLLIVFATLQEINADCYDIETNCAQYHAKLKATETYQDETLEVFCLRPWPKKNCRLFCEVCTVESSACKNTLAKCGKKIRKDPTFCTSSPDKDRCQKSCKKCPTKVDLAPIVESLEKEVEALEDVVDDLEINNQNQDVKIKANEDAIAALPSATGTLVEYSCQWTVHLNDWDKELNFIVPSGAVMKGLYSYHDDQKEDRRWKIHYCYIKIQ